MGWAFQMEAALKGAWVWSAVEKEEATEDESLPRDSRRTDGENSTSEAGPAAVMAQAGSHTAGGLPQVRIAGITSSKYSESERNEKALSMIIQGLWTRFRLVCHRHSFCKRSLDATTRSVRIIK